MCLFDAGTIGMVVNSREPGIAFDELQRTLSSVREQLEIPSTRYRPYLDATTFIFGLVILVVVLALSIVAHEFAHALAAKLVGNTVLGICIGTGRTLIDRNVRGIHFLVRILPLGGYIQSVAHSPHLFRLRQCIVWAAGPGANLLLAAFLGSAWGIGHPLTIANIGLCVVNLIPFSKDIPELGCRVGTDGYQIVEFARGRRPFVDVDHTTEPAGNLEQSADGRDELQREKLGWLRYIAI
jgi:hypothetical protein